MINLESLKNYLNVTYEDEDIDSKLIGILSRADNYIRSKVGASDEDELSATEEQLVYDACRYIFNDAFEDFETNYLSVITGERSARQVAAMEDQDNAG